MDYKELLIKYIRHVGHCEGIDFLAKMHYYNSEFSDEEWEELQKLAELAWLNG